MNTRLNTYLMKALDNYPYDLAEATEALSYALAYDEKNPLAWHLMGKIHMYDLTDYEAAKSYFQEALAVDIYAINVYPDFINLCIRMEDFQQARKLIDFALTIKGIDRAVIYLWESYFFEALGEYKNALRSLKNAKRHTYNSCFMSRLEGEKERIKKKMPKSKRSKKQTKKKKGNK